MKLLILFLLAGLCAAASRMNIDTRIPVYKRNGNEFSIGVQYDGHPTKFRQSTRQATIQYKRHF